jgi:hypothetical protein
MQFLIDADLPRPTADLARSLGHEATDVRDIGLGAAPDDRVAAHARNRGLCLLTGDFDFADIRSYPPHDYAGLVVFAFPKNATRDTTLRMAGALLNDQTMLEQLRCLLAKRLARVPSPRN